MEKIYQCKYDFKSYEEAQTYAAKFIEEVRQEGHEIVGMPVISYDPRKICYNCFVRVLIPDPPFQECKTKAEKLHAFIDRCIKQAIEQGLISFDKEV